MPEALHRALERAADKKGLKGERRDRFIWGTMRNTGWKPEREKEAAVVGEPDKMTRIRNLLHARAAEKGYSGAVYNNAVHRRVDKTFSGKVAALLDTEFIQSLV